MNYEELGAKSHEKEESATRVESPIKSREHYWRIERGKKSARFEVQKCTLVRRLLLCCCVDRLLSDSVRPMSR